MDRLCHRSRTRSIWAPTLANLTVDSDGNSLQMALDTDAAPGVVVYTDTVRTEPGNATGRPAVLASAEGGGAILVADTSAHCRRGRDPL